MPTEKTLLTSVTSDHKKGRRYVEICRAQYDGAALSEDRAQVLNQNPGFARNLRWLIDRCSMPLVAPEGGRIHIVRVPVDPGREWNAAIDAIGPHTGKNGDVRKVGDQYPPDAGKTVEREIVLVNFGVTISDAQHALDWADTFGLSPEKPRGVFSVCEHTPTLHRELGVNEMAVISAVSCSFVGVRRVPGAWWLDAGRSAGLLWFGGKFNAHCWFAFSRE